jgi:hypothetical protein
MISTLSNNQTWNILLPIYYFSFHGISKWDRFFFESWLRLGSDISHDFVNDEFLFSCTAIFIESTLLLTHESCLPTRLTSNDKRSILFSFIQKTPDNEYDIMQTRLINDFERQFIFDDNISNDICLFINMDFS